MKEAHKDNLLAWAFVVLALVAIYFFIGVSFHNWLAQMLCTLIALGLYAKSYQYGFKSLMMVMLTSVTLFITLTISLGAPIETDSPLAVPLVLNVWVLALISFVGAIIFGVIYTRWTFKDRYSLLLLLLFVLVWCILALNVKYYEDWKLENYLTVPFILLVALSYRWFRFSDTSYTLIFIYSVLHIVGSHYTYSEVPLGFWMQHVFELSRNHYDRIVHFAFGFLLAYPMREFVKRVADAKGVWSYYIPIDIVFALSALYEIIEWLVAVVFGGDLGVAYLGSQGDLWDAQKDMLAAGIGSIIAMTVTGMIVIYYNARGFWREFRESLSIKRKRPLGEQAIARLHK